MRPCPICDRPASPYPENPAAPFCSRRCKLVDLGAWLGEGYRVDEQAPPAPPPRRRRRSS
ncbi:MAG: DNA gyrase inhibitor YacG [Sandaracinaceae bacterium]